MFGSNTIHARLVCFFLYVHCHRGDAMGKKKKNRSRALPPPDEQGHNWKLFLRTVLCPVCNFPAHKFSFNPVAHLPGDIPNKAYMRAVFTHEDLSGKKDGNCIVKGGVPEKERWCAANIYK